MVIAVVYAGVSEERAISQRSGERVMEVLQKAGHTVWDVPLDTPLPSEEQMRLLARADAVFLALHGGAGENGELQAALDERHISLRWTDAALALIAERSFSHKYGARNMRRYIQTHVEDVLAEKIIADYTHKYSVAKVTVKDDAIEVLCM